MPDYTIEHAIAGINAKLPTLETWPNQFPGYTITTRFPEYSSVCPKTGLPDFGVITIQYRPRAFCIELKSLKMYLLAYRDLGIFQENIVNRVLRDVVKAAKPVSATVIGDFLSYSSQLNVPIDVSIAAMSGALAGPLRPFVASASVNFPFAGSSSSAWAARAAENVRADARARDIRRETR